MELTRRGFARGAVGLALGSQLGAAAFAQSRPGLSAALAAIRAHGEAHLAYIGIPGLTLGLTAISASRIARRDLQSRPTQCFRSARSAR